MDQRAFGNSDLKAAPVGLGTVKLGRNAGVKYPRAFELPDDDAVSALLNRARDLGVNLIDTAPAYGESEARLGRLLPGHREDWVIASKAGESFDGRESEFDFRPDAIVRSVERSLTRLRTEYLDILLIHSDGRDIEIIDEDGAFETLDRLKERGLIRLGGMSVKTIAGSHRVIGASDVLMATLNEADASQTDAIREAAAQGLGVLIKKALQSGHAASEASDRTIDPIERALRFVYDRAPSSVVIIGTLNPDHLAQNVAVATSVLRDL